MTDIEISRNAKLEKISDVAKKYGITEDDIEMYGKYKAKISDQFIQKMQNKADGDLILVTSINPTPLGEGKTTVSIGLSDALNKLGKKSILALREPSMGPVFGIKGGATGGGYAQVAPMEDINLHFTGDIHAITSANNLLSAIIDNHIYFGNELKIKKVVWKRCLDLNDRELRNVRVGLSKEKNIVPRDDGFDISVASEIMAILCLSKDVNDLERRIGNIIIGYNEKDEEVYAKDLKAEGALTVILKDAINPNIVQTLENNLAIIHGGPFANIAHGCNSIRATKLALKLGDYCVTEAGFGADLGAEKFMDIKCRKFGLKPKIGVIVATIKALKYHGGSSKEECTKENMETLAYGIKNLEKHIQNIRDKFGLIPIVAINRYETDTEKEIEFLKNNIKTDICLVEVWKNGGNGAIDLAKRVIELCKEKNEVRFAYSDDDKVEEKIKKISKEIYGAKDVEFDDESRKMLEKIEKTKYARYPVCISKTQYSLSDDPKNLLCDNDYKININEIVVRNGAEFILAKTGKLYSMPGLPKVPSAENIRLNENGEVEGIF